MCKKCKNIFFYQKCVHVGEHSSIYCIWIIVVHVPGNVFSKVHPACPAGCSVFLFFRQNHKNDYVFNTKLS